MHMTRFKFAVIAVLLLGMHSQGAGLVVEFGDGFVRPTRITNAVAIAAGVRHSPISDNSIVLLADGTVRDWSYYYTDVTNVPAGLSNVIQVATGLSDSLALKADGNVVAWGFDFEGGTNVPRDLHNVVSIAAGEDGFGLAARADGT